jgi:hypothetical protein
LLLISICRPKEGLTGLAEPPRGLSAGFQPGGDLPFLQIVMKWLIAIPRKVMERSLFLVTAATGADNIPRSVISTS